MNTALFEAFKGSVVFEKIYSSVSAKKTAALFGAHPIHRCGYAAALSDASESSVIFITETDREAVVAAADITSFGKRALAFPSRDLVFSNVEGLSHDTEQQRLFVLGNLIEKGADVICCSLEALCQLTMPREIYKALSVKIEQGKTLDLVDLSRRLVAAGYSRFDRVEGKGQFALRGGIVDVFPVHMEAPIRIELFGNEIDSVFEFDDQTQRRTTRLKKAFITPAREIAFVDEEDAVEKLSSLLSSLPDKELAEIVERDMNSISDGIIPPCTDRYLNIFYKKPETLFDYLPSAPLFFNEPHALVSRHKNLLCLHTSELESLAKQGLYDKTLKTYYFNDFSLNVKNRGAVLCDVFARTIEDVPLDCLVNINGNILPNWNGDFALLTEDLHNYVESGYRVLVLSPTPRSASALAGDLCDADFSAAIVKSSDIERGSVGVIAGSLSSGFEISSEKLCVLTSKNESKLLKKKRIKKDPNSKSFGSLEDLTKGDLVVHASHGIGMFDGIQRVDYHGYVRDYIKINYRGEDTLYVPVTQLDMVSQYISPKNSENVKLAKLNSGEWNKTKQAVYRSVREMAKELIELYAKREQSKGVAFSCDGEWQRDFEARFPYDETDEQLKAAEEIKRDMERERPMDRLLCGDVGVGKTEVALRAAFKCVTDGYQCAVLVPTTILAWQHYNTFTERLGAFPVKIAMLSRFATAKEICEAVKGIHDGTVDIAIGTHRLIQKDILFKKLGLLVIDEEQRFGVKHKETLKQTFKGVDVLTLSATPIPRTLNMAMSGIRDMSVIEEPPLDRQPVSTFVIEYDPSLILDAIKRELSRGGQVYYLHNRVETIDRTATKLRELLPDANIEVAHGQMDEDTLSEVWRRLIGGEIDVLVCTTIIETGVDVPNCNTLIVEDADRMGLSQLYQIRGRVGRSARRAYAYFTFRRDKIITEIAAKRLSAIRDFTSFGSGFKIAMRDLQIRGAGSVLSARQSGHMEAVGYDTYLKILSDAVDDERGIIRKPENAECTVDLSVNAYIPESYIPDNESRIEMYKKVAAILNEDDRTDVLSEFLDRFGEVPAAVVSLANISLVRVLGKKHAFYEVTSKDGSVVLFYTDRLDENAARLIIRTNERRILYNAKGKAYISAGSFDSESLDEAALGFISDYDALCESYSADAPTTELKRS